MDVISGKTKKEYDWSIWDVEEAICVVQTTITDRHYCLDFLRRF